jgi:hypothetical protein
MNLLRLLRNDANRARSLDSLQKKLVCRYDTYQYGKYSMSNLWDMSYDMNTTWA